MEALIKARALRQPSAIDRVWCGNWRDARAASLCTYRIYSCMHVMAEACAHSMYLSGREC
jgi:hypothetical protein